jgi:hypothetical protein
MYKRQNDYHENKENKKYTRRIFYFLRAGGLSFNNNCWNWMLI